MSVSPFVFNCSIQMFAGMVLFVMLNSSNRADAAVTPVNPEAGVARTIGAAAAAAAMAASAASVRRVLISSLLPHDRGAERQEQHANHSTRRMPSNAVEFRSPDLGPHDRRRPPGLVERDRRLPQA